MAIDAMGWSTSSAWPSSAVRVISGSPWMKSGGSLRLADRREHSCAQARDLATAPLGDVQVKLKDSDMIVQCADGTLPDGPLIEALSRTPETPVSRAEASRP